MFVGLSCSGVASSEKFIDSCAYDKKHFYYARTIFGSKRRGYIRSPYCNGRLRIKEAIDRFEKNEIKKANVHFWNGRVFS